MTHFEAAAEIQQQIDRISGDGRLSRKGYLTLAAEITNVTAERADAIEKMIAARAELVFLDKRVNECRNWHKAPVAQPPSMRSLRSDVDQDLAIAGVTRAEVLMCAVRRLVGDEADGFFGTVDSPRDDAAMVGLLTENRDRLLRRWRSSIKLDDLELRPGGPPLLKLTGTPLDGEDWPQRALVAWMAREPAAA
jgi:hypothetical protein